MFKEIAYYLTAAVVATPPALTGAGAVAGNFQSVGSTEIKQFLWPYGEEMYNCEMLNSPEEINIPVGPDFQFEDFNSNGISTQL